MEMNLLWNEVFRNIQSVNSVENYPDFVEKRKKKLDVFFSLEQNSVVCNCVMFVFMLFQIMLHNHT